VGSEMCIRDSPKICIKSGKPADGEVKFRFVTVPPWVVLFLLGGLIAVLPVWLMTQKTAKGSLPMAAAASRRLKRARIASLALILGSFVLFFIGLGGDPNSVFSQAVLWLALFSLLAGLVTRFVILPRLGVRGRVGEDKASGREWVQLTGVHPQFAAAASQIYAAGAAPPRAAA